jgi:HlyD family secretion protein
MDTDIAQEVNRKKKRKNGLMAFAVAVLLIASVLILRASFSSSVSRQLITTAVVETGDMENTVSASGEILPEFEQVITSPVNASIKSISKDAGSTVHPGESILSLDKQIMQSACLQPVAARGKPSNRPSWT